MARSGVQPAPALAALPPLPCSTWSIRLLAESIGLFGSVEKVAWLANHTPQEAGTLEPPALPGAPAAPEDKAKKSRGTAGKVVPTLTVSIWWIAGSAGAWQGCPECLPQGLPKIACRVPCEASPCSPCCA